MRSPQGWSAGSSTASSPRESLDRGIAVVCVDPHREPLPAGPLWCGLSRGDPEIALPDPDRDEDRVAIGGNRYPISPSRSPW